MHCFCEHTAMMIQEQHNNNLSVRHKSLDFDTTASLFWKLVALPLLHAKCTCLSNTYQAYDASRRSKRHAAQMGRVVQVSGIAHLVGVQRAVQNNANVKSEPKYLACEESPICAFYFWTLSCSSVALLASMVGWLLCFFSLRVASRQLRSALIYALDSTIAKYQSRCPPRLPSPRNVVPSSCNAHIRYPARAWAQIYILSVTSNWHS